MGGINFSSPLLRGYADNLRNLGIGNPPAIDRVPVAVAQLRSITGVTWTKEMIVALGASRCNDWPEDIDEGGNSDGVSAEGQLKWAAEISPVLGVPKDVAYKAITSGVAEEFNFLCE